MQRLGCRYIMANLIDLWDDRIKIMYYRNLKKKFPKEKVIEIVLRGEILRPRTTRSFVFIDGEFRPFQDNDKIEPKISTPLRDLKG